MNPRRATYLAPIAAMLIVTAAGCASGDDTAAPTPTQPGASANLVELDGVRVDVRRDPG